ncbi:MAG: tyrosine-protein phosphatase [Clostridia bacterium]|nr:tyrosine-protein phosphatase [Clostridia bacterium]
MLNTKNSKKCPKEIFNQYYIKYLNSNVWKWEASNKQLKIKNTKVDIEVTPISEILTGVKNIASMDRDNENAVNVWKNEVKSKDGKVLFSSLRHANTRGKKGSTKQILLAAAVQQYGLDKLTNEANKNKVWEVNLGNVQLMNNWNKFAKKIGENNLISSQMKTFNEFVDKDIAVKLDKNHIIYLKLKDPMLFNFGINEIHYNKILPIDDMRSENLKSFEKLFGKELPSEKCENIFNKKSLNDINDSSWLGKLSGKVGDYVKNNLIDKESIDYKKIKNLSKQILFIWHGTYGHGSEKNPGAIQSRLLALMNLIGYPVSFNCKSGKDRTGILAAEVNNLITSMEANAGEVPDPYKKLDTEERLNLINALEASNSEKITQYNTGYKGIKIRYKKLEKRFGKVKGASGNAKA